MREFQSLAEAQTRGEAVANARRLGLLEDR